MAGSKSDYLENKVLNALFNGAAFPSLSTLYFALYTVAPTDAGGGTECTGGGYARAAVAVNTTNFPTTTNGTLTNGTAIPFPWLSGSIGGTTVAWGLHDASTGGNLLYWGDLDPAYQRTYAADDQPYIPIGALTITEA